MLVLSRRVGEEIVINGSIRVAVVAVHGQKVRLGIVAPPSVSVDRQEVHERRLHATLTDVRKQSVFAGQAANPLPGPVTSA